MKSIDDINDYHEASKLSWVVIFLKTVSIQVLI